MSNCRSSRRCCTFELSAGFVVERKPDRFLVGIAACIGPMRRVRANRGSLARCPRGRHGQGLHACDPARDHVRDSRAPRWHHQWISLAELLMYSDRSLTSWSLRWLEVLSENSGGLCSLTTASDETPERRARPRSLPPCRSPFARHLRSQVLTLPAASQTIFSCLSAGSLFISNPGPLILKECVLKFTGNLTLMVHANAYEAALVEIPEQSD